MTEALTKRQQQGEGSRELILDATERLMATRGYAATSISDIRTACGLPASSIYWHFGSKDGVLAAVMERGANRFFAAIPGLADGEESPGVEVQLEAISRLIAEHPDFLRLAYLLGLERGDDPTVTAAVRRVRDTALAGWRDVISAQLPAGIPRKKRERVAAEAAAIAVAMSDGVFLADHFEPETTDVARMYRRLYQAVTALLPHLLEEK